MTQRKKTGTSKTGTTTVSTESARQPLTGAEEQVVRMRKGVGARDEQQLELKATPNEKARQALLALEKEFVFKMQAQQKERAQKKQKIVKGLRSKPKSRG